MQIKSKSGRHFELPSDEEELAINAGIAADSDTYELTESEAINLRRVGRPLSAVTKERITIRLSRDVTDYFRSSGRGWQTRMDEALQEYISTHR
ncbi:MAG: hypothetical protein GQ475_07500 [Methylococcaceae bacterium]|nr:hypothetical protein [Methylococcaceae bacterium]